MSQTINMNNVNSVSFNNNTVNEIYLNSTKIWPIAPTIEGFLTFSSPSSFSLNVYTTGWDGTLEYSLDKTNWATWNGSSISSSNDNKIYLRGIGNTQVTAYTDTNHIINITGSNVSCSGNIETLLDYQTVLNGNHPTMAVGAFTWLFYGQTALISAPELPATTLSTQCYYNMFFNTSIIYAPELPATQLASNCYQGMFGNCSQLIYPPKLSATTLASRCYASMFYGCVNLEKLPELPATTLQSRCYQSMFGGCSKIKLSTTQTGEYVNAYRIPKTGTGTTAGNALSSMFSDTGGTFTGTPTIDTTYYTSNDIV